MHVHVQTRKVSCFLFYWLISTKREKKKNFPNKGLRLRKHFEKYFTYDLETIENTIIQKYREEQTRRLHPHVLLFLPRCPVTPGLETEPRAPHHNHGLLDYFCIIVIFLHIVRISQENNTEVKTKLVNDLRLPNPRRQKSRKTLRSRSKTGFFIH